MSPGILLTIVLICVLALKIFLLALDDVERQEF